MILKRFILSCGIIALSGPAYAQVELKTYADGDGYIDVQALTCAQLANTYGIVVGTTGLARSI